MQKNKMKKCRNDCEILKVNLANGLYIFFIKHCKRETFFMLMYYHMRFL